MICEELLICPLDYVAYAGSLCVHMLSPSESETITFIICPLSTGYLGLVKITVNKVSLVAIAMLYMSNFIVILSPD